MANDTQITSLVHKTAAGDHEAFEQLINSQSKTINRKIRRMAERREDADDIFQKVMIRVYQRIGTLKSPDAFHSWLHTIVVNECNRHLKSRETIVSFEELTEPEINIPDTNEDYLPCAHVEKLERTTKVKEAIERLPETSKKMVVLYYSDDLGYKEIADHMGVTVGAVSVNLFRAKKRLRKELLRS